ncbi:MAG: DUF3048 domain-containing protein [Chloroflexota bacterium]|nr:DUF3048 domain-containing protein [Chloroflexota bacterium]
MPTPDASDATQTAAPSPQTSGSGGLCPLNGLPIADRAVASRPPLLVQIDNDPVARPASNLTRADIVIEAPVELDMTRFSAIFLCQPTLGLTGPLRSARYYNIDLWQQLHLLSTYFGASNGAVARFSAVGMPGVNGALADWPWFERVSGRIAPHNLYVDVEAFRDSFGRMAALDRLEGRAGAMRPPFMVAPTARLHGGRPVSRVDIQTSGSWQFGWRWDASLGLWQRQDGGVPTTDVASGSSVTAATVVVQTIKEQAVPGDPDPGGNPRRLQLLVGSGAGTLYADGQAISLRWSRASASDTTHWTYMDGTPLVLRPGVIWWEIVPTTASVSEG